MLARAMETKITFSRKSQAAGIWRGILKLRRPEENSKRGGHMNIIFPEVSG